MSAKVRVCKKCSGIKPGDLKGVIAKEDRASGCFGACRKKHPELKGKVYVRAAGKVVAADSKKKLLKALAAIA